MADAWGGRWGERWGERWLAALAVIVPPLPYTLHIHDSQHYVRIADSTKGADIADSSHHMEIEE